MVHQYYVWIEGLGNANVVININSQDDGYVRNCAWESLCEMYNMGQLIAMRGSQRAVFDSVRVNYLGSYDMGIEDLDTEEVAG